MSGIKRSLLAGGAALALAVAGTAASAQSWADGNLYVKGFGGASWPQGESIDFSGDLVNDLKDFGGSLDGSIDYDTGYLLGAAVGYAVTPNVAVELEYAYRNADATLRESLSLPGEDKQNFSENGTVTSNAVMVNGLYRFDPMGAAGAVQPYLGGGIGGVKVDFDGDKTGTEFAYQLMGGVSYALNPNWSLYGEARWFSTDGGEFFSEDGIKANAGFDTVEFLMGASYGF
jgi:opacity protein-like surface antigen